MRIAIGASLGGGVTAGLILLSGASFGPGLLLVVALGFLGAGIAGARWPGQEAEGAEGGDIGYLDGLGSGGDSAADSGTSGDHP